MITYLSSAKYPVGLTFGDISRCLFAMGLDPYNCVELRWGMKADPVPTKPASVIGMKARSRPATLSTPIPVA